MERRPSMALADVESVCASRWPNEAQARAQAAQLEAAGYAVEHHFPPRRGVHASGFRAASVYRPDNGRYIGDVWFSATEPGS